MKETKNTIEFPEYETAFKDYFSDTVQQFMDLKNQLVSGTNKSSFEGPVHMRTNTDEAIIDKEPTLVEMKFVIPFDVIIKTDVEAFMESIEDASNSGIESLMPQLFKFLGEVCEVSGQVVEGKGQSFSYDLFLELIEKIEISFKDDGTPNMPTLFISPSMEKIIKKIQPTEEQTKRLEEVISQKRDDFFAKKRTRKLY